MKCLQGCTLCPAPVCCLSATNRNLIIIRPTRQHKQPPFKQIGTGLSKHGFKQKKTAVQQREFSNSFASPSKPENLFFQSITNGFCKESTREQVTHLILCCKTLEYDFVTHLILVCCKTLKCVLSSDKDTMLWSLFLTAEAEQAHNRLGVNWQRKKIKFLVLSNVFCQR